MKTVLAAATSILSLAAAGPAAAALAVGSPAPNFSAYGIQDGKLMTIEISELLKEGPVVIHFFPSAFADTAGLREFADNIDKFQAAGVSVVGVSRDSIDTLARLSIEVCAGKFPVASADESLVNDGAMFNTRTTYVIAPSGRIVFVHDDQEHGKHVKATLAFIQTIKGSR